MRKWIAGLLLLGLPAFAGSGNDPLAGLVDLDGKPAAISPDGSGAPGVKDQKLVVFWATWCDECRSKLSKELKELNARQDLAVITVNTDRDNDRVKEFVKKENIELPVYRDPTKALRSELKIFSVPHWALYRRNKTTRAFELAMSQPAFDYGQILKAVAEGHH